jgi:hypothetical protein
MNKRIRELAEQAGANDRTLNEIDKFIDIEQFAELIIQECANRATWAQDTDAKDIGGEVLKHFGVRE